MKLREILTRLFGELSFNSLAFRLLLSSALWTLIVLPATGLLINALFRQTVEHNFDGRFENILTAMVSSSLGAAEPLKPEESPGLEFTTALSGYYWQIAPAAGGTGKVLTSDSLVGDLLVFPAATATPSGDGRYRTATSTGPRGERLRMFERTYTFNKDGATRPYSFLVTARLDELEADMTQFRNSLAIALTVLGLGLVLASLFQVRYGLKPLGAIERGLADIRTGKARRLEGDLPAEIVPLQREANALLKSNEDIVERARTHVGNLAHALKTPLSVIANEAQASDAAFAKKVAEQARVMRDQINHHLDRARMVARTGSMAGVTEVKPVADALARTLQRIYAERGISVAASCLPDARFQGERHDLEEMLGNLMDNACKWAKGVVRVAVRVEGARRGKQTLVITVDDDGPGLPADVRAAPVERGRRLDETKPGSGLGHSIVADLAALYDGKFTLEVAELGGLRARLVLPAT